MLEQAVSERRFPVIDVCDDAKIAYMVQSSHLATFY